MGKYPPVWSTVSIASFIGSLGGVSSGVGLGGKPEVQTKILYCCEVEINNNITITSNPDKSKVFHSGMLVVQSL